MNYRAGILLFALSFFLLAVAPPVFAYTPNDPLLYEQWYLDRISAPTAWDTTQGSSDVVVAVLDTGVDPRHPDLAGNFWTNPDEIAGDGIDNDQNGYVDDVHGWDFVDGDATPEPDVTKEADTSAVAHGTAIAGVIAAIGDNGIGIAGIAWRVRIMPVRILDNFGSGNSEDARSAVRYAIDNGADVINLSFTGQDIDTQFEDAIRDAYNANIVVVAAVGNGENGGLDTDVTPIYPACFKGEDGADWVVGVGSTNTDDTKADFSNYGSNCTDLAAPGHDIFSTMYTNPDWEPFDRPYLGGWSGTSIASPMVAGTAALIKSQYPTLTVTNILNALRLSADPIQDAGTVAEGKLGTGRLNVARALELAGTYVPPPFSFPTGSFVRSRSFDTVYYVDADYHRHPVMNALTYFTWRDSFDAISWVSDEDLAKMQLGTPLPPKPGVVLVKFESVPDVYVVSGSWDAPVRRRIASEEIAHQMFGLAWADYVIDVEPTFFMRYAEAEDIVTAEPVDLTILKTRLWLAERSH